VQAFRPADANDARGSADAMMRLQVAVSAATWPREQLRPNGRCCDEE
jgi:hypothetical protein